MSDTGKPAEINEVLTSIRRLVSDGAEGDGSADAPLDEPQLLLTPALRIEEAEPVVAPLLLVPKQNWEETSLDDRILRLENAVSANSGNWTPILASDTTEDAVAAEPLQLLGPLELTSPVDPVEPAEDDAPEEVEQVPEALDAPIELEAQDAPAEPEEVNSLDTPELRALIATVLREELQGEVGDKLSQNLRKVVRREIARALSDRDDA